MARQVRTALNSGCERIHKLVERSATMSTQVRITLQDEIYRRAKRLAEMSNREVEELLAQAIELSFSPVSETGGDYPTVSTMSDQEVIELSELQMAPRQDRRFGKLLDKQQAGTLNAREQSELLALMQFYQESLLRKAQALGEAVRRGLRQPLTP